MARHILPLAAFISLLFSKSCGQSVIGCGADTFLDTSSNQCICASSQNATPTSTSIYLGGLMDTTSYPWAPDVFEVTVKLLNEGFFGNVFDQSVYSSVSYSLGNSKCNETIAVQEYWKLRQQNGNQPPDGLIGARCSGPSTVLAQISGLEEVPHLSPASNSAKLSSGEFPLFSRLVAPNNEKGEVGALVALFMFYGWDRVTILETDTQFSKDLVTEFRKAFPGSIAYSDTIRLGNNDVVDMESVQQALNGVPTDDPTVNSRIILLAAHNQHAYDILQEAHVSGFQKDTIWIGPSSWVGRQGVTGKTYDLPENPGYMGAAPFRNRDQTYQKFLSRYMAEIQQSQPVDDDYELEPFAAETVDSIVAMTRAIAQFSPTTDGATIVKYLRTLDFPGVSGRVQFTAEGDRKDPTYTFLNSHSSNSNGADWTAVGDIEAISQVVTLNSESVCFAEVGCDPTEIPEDSYPVPPIKLPGWAVAMIVILMLAFAVMAFKYYRSHTKKRKIKAELDAFRNSVVGMCAVEKDFFPRLSDLGDGDVEQALTGSVTSRKAPTTWCWQETDMMMKNHNDEQIFGDPADCWIKYDDNANSLLEAAFAAGMADCRPLDGYVVDFKAMEQKKIATNFIRAVKRVEVHRLSVKHGSVERSERLLPKDLRGEPQMVLLEGDVVQISTRRDDGWAFGTKLHHADEAAARDLVVVANQRTADDCHVEDSIFCDTGWFPMDYTRVPTAEDLKVLQQNVNAGDLDPPAHWEDIKNATMVERYTLKEGDPERTKVVKAFMSTLHPPNFNKKIAVVKVERIQNFASWQSYIVKRQTICYRETGHTADDDDDAAQRKALERFERSWLWHGSNAEVVDKILQQGFNRSFCGKNATMYGKGVYFARDASYSAYPLYSVPNEKGHQFIMACRVVVGEYCRGKQDAVTPDIRDAKSHSLYDSTVGLLSNDTMSNPSIFVTYHDAQAYPEYLITFKTS